jgi:hypothetical protein
MRIRSIKPEFWRSDDVAALDPVDRLLFVGIWSYVDDNGVGLDKLASIAADLFAGDLERDAPETFARVSRGLSNLAEAGLIARYTVAAKRYLAVTGWDRHQRVDKPNKERYPRPDQGFHDKLATPSGDSRESSAPGTGEQGNRGTGEQGGASASPPVDNSEESTDSSTPSERPSAFCSKHPGGTDRRCRACGDARRAHDAWTPPAAAVPPPRAPRWDPATHCEHGQLLGACDACDYEQAHAATILRPIFGVSA